jgi:hypothetical protein
MLPQCLRYNVDPKLLGRDWITTGEETANNKSSSRRSSIEAQKHTTLTQKC